MSEADQGESMPAWRKALATGCVCLILVGFLFDWVRKTSHWPFHPSGMFSNLSRSPGHIEHRLLAVDEKGGEFLLSDPAYSEPILIYHVRLAFERASDQHRGRCEKLEALARDYMERYERHRKEGWHSGPPIRGLRLYELTWTRMDAQARNSDRPDRKTLLFDSAAPCPPTAREGKP